jgi:hypothetical protein
MAPFETVLLQPPFQNHKLSLRLLRRAVSKHRTLPRFFLFLLLEPRVPLGVFLSIEKLEEEETMGRGILLWLLGVPIPVIILLWLFFGR